MAFEFSRPGTDDIDAMLDLDAWAFPSTTPPEEAKKLPFPLDLDRTEVVHDPHSGHMVGIHGSYDFAQLPVPGARASAAGLTWVGVHPQYRRRGILRQMMGHHLAHCQARGEAISVLHAAEPAIYGRFGYGIATHQLSLTVPRGAQLRPVPGTSEVAVSIEHFSMDTHAPLIKQLHAAQDRPGWATRTSQAQEACYLADLPQWRGGTESARMAVARCGEEVVGYARFARTEPWANPDQKGGSVRVREWCAGSAPAAAALLSTLTNLDLMGRTELRMLPTDDAVTHLLVDLRECAPRISDGVWLRIVDLPAALAARRYSATLDIVLEVTDTLVPSNAGRWAIRADADGTQAIEQTLAPADATIDIRDLGSLYLGGITLASLAAAGLVQVHRPEVLAQASTALSWPVAPACTWVF